MYQEPLPVIWSDRRQHVVLFLRPSSTVGMAAVLNAAGDGAVTTGSLRRMQRLIGLTRAVQRRVAPQRDLRLLAAHPRHADRHPLPVQHHRPRVAPVPGPGGAIAARVARPRQRLDLFLEQCLGNGISRPRYVRGPLDRRRRRAQARRGPARGHIHLRRRRRADA